MEKRKNTGGGRAVGRSYSTFGVTNFIAIPFCDGRELEGIYLLQREVLREQIGRKKTHLSSYTGCHWAAINSGLVPTFLHQ